MPIHSQGYRPFEGTREPLGFGWSIIAWDGIRRILSKRLFLGLLLLAWLPFVVRAVQIYAVVNLPQARFLELSSRTFRDFLDQQALFVFFITVWVGAGLIANDLRSNALQLYLSRPLTRLEYAVGKLAILGSFLLLVTWLPAMLLLLLQILLAGSFEFLRDNISLVPAITLVSGLMVLESAFTMLALSALSKSARFVAITYAGVLFFTEAVFGVIRGVTSDSTLSGLSVSGSIAQLADAAFGLPHRFATPLPASLAVQIVIVLLAVAILRWRVRAVEVVQ